MIRVNLYAASLEREGAYQPMAYPTLPFGDAAPEITPCFLS